MSSRTDQAHKAIIFSCKGAITRDSIKTRLEGPFAARSHVRHCLSLVGFEVELGRSRKVSAQRSGHHTTSRSMRFLCLAAALATATAFTTSSPTAFSSVGERALANVFSAQTHRTRKSTIVMDGKANGT